jgi:hypothetical protein
VNAAWVLLAFAAVPLLAYAMTRLADHVLLTEGDDCRLKGDS